MKRVRVERAAFASMISRVSEGLLQQPDELVIVRAQKIVGNEHRGLGRERLSNRSIGVFAGSKIDCPRCTCVAARPAAAIDAPRARSSPPDPVHVPARLSSGRQRETCTRRARRSCSCEGYLLSVSRETAVCAESAAAERSVAASAARAIFGSRAAGSGRRVQQRRGPESNRRIAVLQTAALPLGYRARSPVR